jgi:hypothetical protein
MRDVTQTRSDIKSILQSGEHLVIAVTFFFFPVFRFGHRTKKLRDVMRRTSSPQLPSYI